MIRNGSQKSVPTTYPAAKLIEPRELFSLPRETVEHLCRERTNAVYVGDHQVMSWLLARYKFLTSTNDRGFAPHIFLDGFWEIWLTKFIVNSVQTGWTAIDVGANFGYYTLLLADLVGSKGQVIAFEPNPAVAECAEFSVSINGFGDWVQVHDVALSDKVGSARFFVPDGEPKNAQLDLENKQTSGGSSFDVPVTSIDSLNLDRLDFMKVDAEGGEHGIFMGARHSIDKFNPLIIMEYNSTRPNCLELAREIFNTYDKVEYLDNECKLVPVSLDNLIERTSGEDLLLVLKR